MAQFLTLVAELPAMIPDGKDGDVLAAFSRHPSTYITAGTSDDELWEEVINPMLDHAFAGRSDSQWEGVITRGKQGLDGFCVFAAYWIQRKVGVWEPRIERLTRAIQL
jgi:hypothetical protein